jgi:putative heme-binding domain-containing protein
VTALARPAFREQVVEATRDARADVRLGALLALRRARHAGGETVAGRLLADPDPRVRQMAMVWAGEAGVTSLGPELKKGIVTGQASATLLETYLATAEMLTPEFVEAHRGGKEPKANSLKRRLDPKVVEGLVRDESNAAGLRALALTRLERPEEPRNFEVLRSLLRSKDLPLRLEAARTLADCRHPDAAAVLLDSAKRRDDPSDARAEALLALTRQAGDFIGEVLPLLDDPDAAVRSEAVRFLRGAAGREEVRAALARQYEAARDDAGLAAFAERLEFALIPPAAGGQGRRFPRPASLEQWQSALSRGGDPASGRRVFFSAAAGCARCHTIDNRGGRLGPDLSRIGTARSREQIVHAVLRPSDEYSIDYQAWFVKTKGGDKHLGLQLDLKDRGDIELFTLDAKTTHFKGAEIEAYGALKQSLMPDGLEAAMSVEDFRDLVAFLESLN